MHNKHVDVVIVGAGLAGLSAAKELQSLDKSVLVLEARDRVGGRSWTQEHTAYVSTPDEPLKELNYWIDDGAQWVGPTQTMLLDLIEEADIQKMPGFPEQGKIIFIFKGQRFEIDLSGNDSANSQDNGDLLNRILECFKPHFNNDLQEFKALQKQLDRMAKDFEAGKPWLSANAKSWDAMTLQTWIGLNAQTDGARFLLRLNCMLAFASLPCDISLLHFLHYIRAAGSVAELETSQIYRLKGGTQAISRYMADQIELKGGCIELNSPVWGIHQTEGQSDVVLDDGTTYTAQKVIVTVPPAIIPKIRFTPSLPAGRQQFNQRMPMGSSIKVHVVYETAFWREIGFSGIAASDQHAMSYLTDNGNSKAHEPGILGGFIEIDTVRNCIDEPLENLQALVTATIEDIFEPSMGKIPKPLAVHILKWGAEEWSGGCYAGVMPPGVWTGYKGILREPVGHIHWAGTETSPRWFAYMEGAVQSGVRVANELSFD